VIGRLVEIAEDNRHLSVSRGFLVAESASEEIGRVPLDDILAVIGNAHGLSYSNNLLVELAARGIPFVLCGRNHAPVGVLWALDGNFDQSRRIQAQIAAPLPQRKRLWATLVKQKILMQAAALDTLGRPTAPLTALAKKIRSGDPSNVEAQAARRYWSLLMGSAFTRDQDGEGPNALLNYGYTVLRSATARAVVAAGLHPGVGIHHRNAQNPMCLVDDLMEPFRPVIDLEVAKLVESGNTQIGPDTKRHLVHALYRDLETTAGRTPVTNCLHQMATSLAQVLLGERDGLDLPKAVFNQEGGPNGNAVGVPPDVDDRNV
jgi:CRISPR-associated protein Cas1